MKNVDLNDPNTISAHLKRRFCKDCNIPINIYDEPYFMDRLELLNPYYLTLYRWQRFIKGLDGYDCEQDYFEDYNRIKDAAISDIKNTAEYELFNNLNMNEMKVPQEYETLPKKDIFHDSNKDRCFISIDMKKANFSSLHWFSSQIFGGAATWEEFISKYTSNPHIIQSKYVRQVILGNCNSKRHITLEKYIMSNVLNIVRKYISMDKVVFFSNDEIVLDVTDILKKDAENLILKLYLDSDLDDLKIPLEIEHFTLRKLGNIGYYKEFEDGIEFKCINNFMLPFAIRKIRGEEVQDSDRIFLHEGIFAKYIEVPNFSEEDDNAA